MANLAKNFRLMSELMIEYPGTRMEAKPVQSAKNAVQWAPPRS